MKQNNFSLSLETGAIIIYQKEGLNLVKQILNGPSYGYKLLPYDTYNNIDIFGYINKYTNYKSYDEFSKFNLKDNKKIIEEEFKIVASEKYFYDTSFLAKEYSDILSNVSNNKEIINNTILKHEIYDNLLSFISMHPEIDHDLDPRFNQSAKITYIKSKNNNLKRKIDLYEANPNLTLEEYKNLVEIYYQNKLTLEEEMHYETIENLGKLFTKLLTSIKSNINKYHRIGLIEFGDYESRIFEEIEFGSIDNLKIDDFLTFKQNTIYWITD